MALKVRILGSCSVGKIGSFEFYPGEDKTLKCQVYDSTSSVPVVLSNAATNSVVLPGTPTNITIGDADITISTTDVGVFSINLTDTQTLAMISGNIKFTSTESGVTQIAIGEFLIKKLTTNL